MVGQDHNKRRTILDLVNRDSLNQPTCSTHRLPQRTARMVRLGVRCVLERGKPWWKTSIGSGLKKKSAGSCGTFDDELHCRRKIA